jgi:hypothetical protein
MTSGRAMAKIQDYLQTEDEEVKSSTFSFLTTLLNRFFPEKEDKDEIRGHMWFETQNSEESAVEDEP